MPNFIIKNLVPFFFTYFIGKKHHLENIPLKGPVIFAANHASYLDHFIIGATIMKKSHRMIYYLAKKEHFDTFIQRQWHKFLKAIPVDRQAGGREGLLKAIEHLHQGNFIMIYPEGTRTLTGKMNRARTGVARLAIEAKVPVIPIGVTNTFKMLPKGKWIPKLGLKADVDIGKPMTFESYYGKGGDKKAVREVTTKIMKRIGELSNQTYDFD